MATRFHVNSPLALGWVVLSGPEAHHLAVSRLRPGDAVCLFNGDGREYRGKVAELGKRNAAVSVEEAVLVDRERRDRLVVAAPLPKGDRGQFLAEKLTELGATEFVLLETERTVTHPGEAKRDKLERWVIEASKQCGRNVLMPVRGPLKWVAFVRDAALPAARWLAHPGGEEPPSGGEAVLAVGPEGGFTDAEVAAAQAAGWRTAGLGPRLLRIETAALAMAARM